MVRYKPNERSVSIPAALTMGAAAASIITLLGCAVTAKMIEAEKLAEDKMGYLIMVILILAAYTSGMITRQKSKNPKITIPLLSGAVYWGLLMSICALFFGGQYTALWETLLLVMCGSLLSAIPMQNGQKGRGQIRIPNR